MNPPAKYRVQSQFNTDYKVIWDDYKWYYDCSDSLVLRNKVDEKGEIIAVDPDGGPIICKDDFLCEHHCDLPLIKILKITPDTKHKRFQLHV